MRQFRNLASLQLPDIHHVAIEARYEAANQRRDRTHQGRWSGQASDPYLGWKADEGTLKKTGSTRKSPGKGKKSWTDYEEVARYVLQQLGKRFGLAEMQGKQKIAGQQSGTTWEIDAKGVREGNGAIVLVECRRYKNRLTQEALGAVAYRIIDTGAEGGIVVSPLPLQKGAAKVAAANSIEHVQLQKESSKEVWVAQLGKVVHVGIADTAQVTMRDSFQITVTDAGGNVVERRSG